MKLCVGSIATVSFLGVLAFAGLAGAQARGRAGAAAAGAGAAAPAAGGNAPSAAGGAGASGEPAATLRTEGGRRVYVSSATIEVRGEIQRPYAFSLSGRSSLGYSYVDVPVHFLQEIINAVRHAPF
jgi:hypothetical protein